MAECPILQVLLQLEPSRSISRGKGTKRIRKGRKGSRDRYKKKSFPIEFQWAFYISVGARVHMCVCVCLFSGWAWGLRERPSVLLCIMHSGCNLSAF
jgi:hypothetical protein